MIIGLPMVNSTFNFDHLFTDISALISPTLASSNTSANTVIKTKMEMELTRHDIMLRKKINKEIIHKTMPDAGHPGKPNNNNNSLIIDLC